MRLMLFACLVLAGCIRVVRTGCVTTATKLLQQNAGKVHIAYQENGQIRGISDNKQKRSIGGAYYFNKRGVLTTYRFFRSDSAYIYEQDYDSWGQVTNTVGKMLVDETIREITLDSASVEVRFFSLNKSFQHFQVQLMIRRIALLPFQ